ncbi:Leu/Phe/Val dehydrogenase [Sphingomonas oryzagri]
MVKTPDGSPLIGQLHIIDDRESGTKGVIAIHSTALGPAAGGCRTWDYASPEAMATDAIRLARGMSYKNALAGLPFGGGKAVLQRPAAGIDRKAVMRAFAAAVEQLHGSYVTAEDVGTTVADMELVARHTRYVAGLDRPAGMAGGDPSPWTALGVFLSMQAASRLVLGSDVRGLTVLVQGLGNVGSRLCDLLHNAGARLVVTDLDAERARGVACRYGATLLPADEILAADGDIFAPCALGAVLTPQGVGTLKVGLVCGGANNQLLGDEDGLALLERGIAYCPDYVVNAGGIINVACEYLGESVGSVQRRIDLIGERLVGILSKSRQEQRPSNLVADEMAAALIRSSQRAAA